MASGMKIDTSGMDAFMKKVEEAATPEQVNVGVLFNDAFLQKHTRFSNVAIFEASIEAAGVTEVNTLDDLNTKEVDQVVAANSDFQTFEEMLGKAAAERIVAKFNG